MYHAACGTIFQQQQQKIYKWHEMVWNERKAILHLNISILFEYTQRSKSTKLKVKIKIHTF